MFIPPNEGVSKQINVTIYRCPLDRYWYFNCENKVQVKFSNAFYFDQWIIQGQSCFHNTMLRFFVNLYRTDVFIHCYTPDRKISLLSPLGDEHWIQRVKRNHTPDWFPCSQNSPSGIPSVAGWPITLQSSHVQKSSFVLASLFIIVTCLKPLLVIITSLLCVWRPGKWIWLVEALPNVNNCKCWWCHLIFFCLILF